MIATDTSPVSVASYFVNMYFVGCLLQSDRQSIGRCSLRINTAGHSNSDEWFKFF